MQTVNQPTKQQKKICRIISRLSYQAYSLSNEFKSLDDETKIEVLTEVNQFVNREISSVVPDMGTACVLINFRPSC